jgi:hypothetical protein
MKTAMTITSCLITMAMSGQKPDGFLSSKAFRLQQAYQIDPKTSDTSDYTDFFIEGNGFIMIMNYENNRGIFSVDKGQEKIIFLGVIKSVNNQTEKDSIIYTADYIAGGKDSLHNVTITRTYLPGSFEETGEKIVEFHMTSKNEIWDFITTEIITGKKDF